MRRGGTARIVTALVGMLVLAVSCSSGAANNTAATATTNPPFTYHPGDIVLLRKTLAGEKPGNGAAMGTRYVSTALTIDGAPQAFVDGRHLEVGFYAGRFHATIHCASLVDAAYEITDDAHLVLLALDPTGATIVPPDVGNPFDCGRTPTATEARSQDTALSQMLRSSPTVSLVDGTLTLSGNDMTVSMIDTTTTPVLPLVGTTWIGTALAFGRTFHTIGGTEAVTLVFGADGKVAITFGCNDGGADYVVDGESMTFSGYHLTSRDCPGTTADALAR